MSFLRGLSTNVTCAGLTFALGFANQSLLARGLGVAPRGVLALMTTSVVFGGMFFGEWLSRGNSFTVGREPERTGPVWANTGLFVLLLLGAMTAVAALAAGVPVLPFDLELSTPRLFLLGALVVAVVAQRGYLAILLGGDRLTAYAVVPVLFIGSYLALNSLALGPLAAGLDGVLLAWLAATVLAAAVALVLTRAPGGVASADLRRTASVGTRGAVSATLLFLLFRSNVYFVGLLLDVAAVGVYAIVMVIAEMMQRLPNIAGTVMLPKVLGGGDDDHGLSLAVSRWTLGFSLLAAAGVVLVGASLIEVAFGLDFAGAYEPLTWMLPGLVASGVGSVLNTKLAGQGYPPVTLWAPAAALVVNAVLNLVFIPELGLRGAGLSTSVAYALWAAIIAVAYQRHTGVTWARFLRAPAS